MSIRIIKAVSIILILFLSAILGFNLFLRTKYTTPIIMYHYVFDTKINNEGKPVVSAQAFVQEMSLLYKTNEIKIDKLIVSPKTFEQQMRFLKVNNYNVISLEECARFIREKRKIPKNTVVITLDDGSKDNYENAYPLLKKYGLKATMFIIVDFIAKQNFMTEKQIKEMSDSGLITIGSHTLNHFYLPKIKDENELKREIYDSKKKLEAILNKPVNCFCYPIGGFNKRIRNMVIDAGYTVAVTTSPGMHYPNDDIYALKRVRISENSKNLFVFWFESSGLYKYLLELHKNSDLHKDKNNEE